MSEWMTTKQVAEFYQISAATLENWRWLKKGPAYSRIGRLVRYDRQDVIRFRESHRVDAEASNELTS